MGASLLVFANKSDKANCMSNEEIQQVFLLLLLLLLLLFFLLLVLVFEELVGGFDGTDRVRGFGWTISKHTIGLLCAAAR